MRGNIVTATFAEASQILQLLNSAYRGEAAKKGWTHEADLISGNKLLLLDEVQ